jgi:hypothetical protein
MSQIQLRYLQVGYVALPIYQTDTLVQNCYHLNMYLL